MLSKNFEVVFQIREDKDGFRLWQLKPSITRTESESYDSIYDAYAEILVRIERYEILKNSLTEKFIQKSIEFTPEHKQAGLQILNYFQETLNQKYPDDDVTVRIGQKGNLVTMEIETPDGETEKYEKALEEYGLVVSGEKDMAEYLPNKIDQMALEHQLRMAHLQIENQREILQLKSESITDLKEELQYFKEELRLATRTTRFALKKSSVLAKKPLDKNDPVELLNGWAGYSVTMDLRHWKLS